MKENRARVFVKAMSKRLSAQEAMNQPSFGGKTREQAVKKLIKEADDAASAKSNEYDEASFMSGLRRSSQESALQTSSTGLTKKQKILVRYFKCTLKRIKMASIL